MGRGHRVPPQLRVAVFPGTTEERGDLLSAVRRNCACTAAVGSSLCGPHDLLLLEGTLKRLVFYRRWRHSLTRAEWLEDPRWREA
jgi:hypothetical protein